MSLSRRVGLTTIAITLSVLGACGDDSDTDAEQTRPKAADPSKEAERRPGPGDL